MSIIDEISRLYTNRVDIRESLANKGAQGTSSMLMEDFPEAIDNLETVSVIAVPVQRDAPSYTGSAITATFAGYNSSIMTIGGTTSATNAGTYSVTFTLNTGYMWSDLTTEVKTVSWIINKAEISHTPPEVISVSYDGSSHTLLTAASSSIGTIYYKIYGGTYSTSIPTASAVGSYTMYYKITGNSNYKDVDDTNVGISYINAADLSNAVIASISDYDYTGSAICPTPTVTYNSVTLVSGTDFTYSYAGNVEPGVATVTANGIGNYQNSKSQTFNIISLKPEFTSTSAYTLIDDGSNNWRIKLTTSGTISFSNLGKGKGLIDIFCVGGGGGGAASASYYGSGGGGGGGYTKTYTSIQIAQNTSYTVNIGSGGSGGTTTYGSGGFGTQTYFISTDYSANTGVPGGYNGGTSQYGRNGGAGGSGGGTGGNNGGENGGNGSTTSESGIWAGSGQGTTTAEFGVSGSQWYSGGGAGGKGDSTGGGAGGATKGITGASSTTQGVSAAANTGGGGGGGAGNTVSGYGGAGGTGIVVIRNHR